MDAVPPPPAGPTLAARQAAHEPASKNGAEGAGGGVSDPVGETSVYPFDAEVELAELDERGKTGTPWAARSRTLSRGTISISSRRMCHLDRRVLVAVHRVDAEPMVLLGRVEACRYDSGGLYVVDLELLPLDEAEVRLTFSRRR